ncbi:MAG: MFS transporter [Promethearchaeota archaeon]|nr:MAG: MFS transporter [Candidatus Lokiarchaeota archaeon]
MNLKEKVFSKFLRRQVLLIGLLYMGDYLFFFFEQNYFNTYLDHVLYLPELFISIMVSLSATVGLISMPLWGIASDNTRTKYGRRRPFLLFGIIAGFGMVLFSFAYLLFGRTQIAFIWCLIIDVLLIGIASNAFLVAERALIPDTIELEKRGRANGIINSISYIGLLIGVAFLLLGNELFGIPDPRPGATGTIITQDGHMILLSTGGLLFAIVGIIGFFFIKEKPVSELPEKKKFFTELKQTFNLTELKSHKEFFKILLARVIFQSGISSIMPFLFIFIFDQGLGTLQLLLGIAIAFPWIFIATIYLGRLSDKFGRKRFVPISMIIVSIGYLIMPFAPGNYILFVIGLPFVLVGVLSLITPLNAWSQDLLPEEKRGKFTGILNIVNTVSQIIGSFAGGIVATLFGISWIFVLGPIFFLASIPLFLKVKETVNL